MTICIFLPHISLLHWLEAPQKSHSQHIFLRTHPMTAWWGDFHSTKHAAPRRLININSQSKKELLEEDGRCLSPTAQHLEKSPSAPGETFLQFPDSSLTALARSNAADKTWPILRPSHPTQNLINCCTVQRER